MRSWTIALLAGGLQLAAVVFGEPFGTLERGAPADLVVLDYRPPTPLTSENLAGHLLFGVDPSVTAPPGPATTSGTSRSPSCCTPCTPRAPTTPFERELRSWLAWELLLLDDFGLRKLSAQQSSDLYDVLVERDRRVATVITSNRAVDEWVALFDDPILANSALDRFAHRAHQIVMEGPSLRASRAPSPTKLRRPSKHAPEGG